ncbi:MAG: substrate-binding domain-containing protein [Proteobacteria bacterium]|nr:substrate-binding domain-containing protein [Burkholderiales bacterium]
MKRMLLVFAVYLCAMLPGAMVHAQPQRTIKVLSDEPLQLALGPIAEAFRRDTGIQVEYVFGPSPVLVKRAADGEAADALLVQPEYITELQKSGRVAQGQATAIGRVGFGLASRSDGPPRDIIRTE